MSFRKSRVDRTFVHRGDYKSRHAIESRKGDTGCLKCHGRSFCSACHERNDVGARLGTRNPHPRPFPHKRVARRRIAECAGGVPPEDYPDGRYDYERDDDVNHRRGRERNRRHKRQPEYQYRQPVRPYPLLLEQSEHL